MNIGDTVLDNRQNSGTVIERDCVYVLIKWSYGTFCYNANKIGKSRLGQYSLFAT